MVCCFKIPQGSSCFFRSLMRPPIAALAVLPLILWEGHALVDLSVAEGKLTLHVRGADKLCSFKRSLEIPLAHIAGVRADPEVAPGWYHGIRMPGINVPGVITAGTFYQDGNRIFWDVHHPEKTIVIDLHDERYNQLVVEVDDPDTAVQLIQNARFKVTAPRTDHT